MNQQLTEEGQWAEFWAVCSRLLTIYPERPAGMSGDAEAKQLERQLKELGSELLPVLCESDHWVVEASVGKGNWASVPWVAFFDSRETTSAQKGVYPVIHLSSEAPVGIRIGLGIAAKAYRGREDEKAAAVWEELGDASRRELTEAGFVDVVNGTTERTPIGSGDRAKRYDKGMVFERFVEMEEMKRSPAELTAALKAMLVSYQGWVERKSEVLDDDSGVDFLTLMREYAEEHIVFMSPQRDRRFFISEVDDRGCSVQRLDSDSPARVTASAFQTKLAWLKDQGGQAIRKKIDNTTAVQICYLQMPELGLMADRQTAVVFESDTDRADNFVSLIHSMGAVTLYKPVILSLVIEAIRDGELTDNRILFDWLLPRFVARMRQHGKEVGEQQLAEGFGRLASDLFWMLAHHNTNELLDVSAPTAAKIRDRVSHARLQEAYWEMLQDAECSKRVLNSIKDKWWPSNTVDPIVKPESDIATATASLVQAIAASGFIFHPWQIATYVTAMRTKPFVILAGVSGTGKSKLPALVAELTTGKIDRVSVRPDWTDSSDVLGYVDLQDRFRPGVVLKAARVASTDTERFHVCLLDEMNLARVEHYFAEVLSSIEDRRKARGGGYESTKLVAQTLPAEFVTWQEQTMPANFGIVGTVNMDESSHGFSRKVLDRAFTLELSEVDLDLDQSTPSDGTVAPVYWPPSFWHCRATRISECDHEGPGFREAAERATTVLQDANKCLVHSQLQVGYRTRDEVILFLLNANELKDSFVTRDGKPVDPLDLALMMKVLPRLVGGSNAIRRTMIGLLGLAHGQTMSESDVAETAVESWAAAGRPDAIEGVAYPRTVSRLCLMWERLTSEGYTSFWL